jgi:hypothetical protein
MTAPMLNPVMEMDYDPDFDLNPDFDALCAELGLNPGLDIVLYEGPDGDLLDACDRSDVVEVEAPLSWFPPTDLSSFASMLAGRIGTTFTSYTRDNAEAVRWMIENGRHSQPETVADWVAQHRPAPAQIDSEAFVEATLVSVAVEQTGPVPLFQEPEMPTLLGLLDEEDDDDRPDEDPGLAA